jgi:glutamate/tyrosine decarboxylase-like PLP-dependent enzyme
MAADEDVYRGALDRARDHSLNWLASLASRPVGPQQSFDQLLAGFSAPLPENASDPVDVVDELARLAEPGLMAMPSGRFFGWVVGGTLPAALAADWLVSAWDQNAALRFATPAVVAAEEAAAGWLLDLLGLPAEAGVGFTTGATMANFVGLAAARKHVLDRVGWDLHADGLTGAPRITVLVGEERHTTVDLALRYLGLGTPIPVAVDREGRIRLDALATALGHADGPVILCLQAGNLHSGGYDPMRHAIAMAHNRGAWVHIDGAFGLWAAVSPRYRDHLDGYETADSWATDAHKTLNVPYDCGIAIVNDAKVLQSAFGAHTSYLIHDEASDPFERVPEFSRRARGVPVWAALRSLGRSGIVAMVESLAANAQALATGLAAIPGVEILNDVVFTQVSLSFGSDERTRLVTQQLIAGGEVWMSGSRWRDRDILRISVSNWSTDAPDVATAVAAVERASAAVPAR